MDGRTFDDLARAVVGGTAGRRGLLRFLAGGAGAMLLASGGEEAAAACKAVGKPCGRKSDCCSQRCKNDRCKCSDSFGFCQTDDDCCGTLTCCGGSCVSLDTDQDNCGTCGFGCPAGRGCDSGQCCTLQGDACGETTECCFAGTLSACCGGVCADVFGDETNCGECGATCSPGDICFGGECCLDIGAACLVADNRCCGNRQCKPTDQQGNGRCCLPQGAFCFANGECCRGRCRRGRCRNQ